MSKKKLVVIGNGMAGARAVEEVLARGGADLFDIVMFGDEPYGNYNRIMLSNILSGQQDTSEILLNPLAWYAENGITLHAGERVTEIDRFAKVVRSENGLTEHYDRLLIATGSRPFMPPIAGLHAEDGTLKPGVFGFRTIDDCNGMVAAAGFGRKAAVIGGGLLGLEAARGLLNLWLRRSCGPPLWPPDGPPARSNWWIDPEDLDGKDGDRGPSAEIHHGGLGNWPRCRPGIQGRRHADCELLVMAAGIRPNSDVALRAGLTAERAIVVDNHMRCVDDMSVYAVGECAQHRGKVYGLVAPIWDQAKVFAEHVTGRDLTAAYHGSKLATKLKVMGVELASMGITEPSHEDDETIQFSEPKRGVYKKLIVRNGRLVGGILMGDISKAAYLMQPFDRDSPLPDERLSLLFDLGTPSQKVTLDEMPADAQVCNCNGVTKGAIGQCVAVGQRTPTAVMNATRAGKGCGSCKSLVAEVVAWFSGGEVIEDSSVHYYVPTIPLRKPDLVQAIREQGLKSVSSVVRALAGGQDDASGKPALA